MNREIGRLLDRIRRDLDALEELLAKEPEPEPEPEPDDEPDRRPPAEPRDPEVPSQQEGVAVERMGGPYGSAIETTTVSFDGDKKRVRTVRTYAGWKAREAGPVNPGRGRWVASGARESSAREKPFVMLPRTVQVSDFSQGTNLLARPLSQDTGGPLQSTCLPFDGPAPNLAAAKEVSGPWRPLSDTGQPVPNAAGGGWLGFHPGVVDAVDLLSAIRRVGDWQTVPSCSLGSLVEGGKVVSEQLDLQARAGSGGGPEAQAFYPDGSRGHTDENFLGDPMVKWVGRWGNQGFDGQHYRRATWWHEALVRQYPEYLELVRPDIRDLARMAAYYLSPYEATGASTNPAWRTKKSLYYRSWDVPPNTIRQEAWPLVAVNLAMLVGYKDEFEFVASEFLRWAEKVIYPSGALQRFGVDEGAPPPRNYGVKDGERSQADIEWPMIFGALAGSSLLLTGEIPDWLREAIEKAATAYLDCWPEGQGQKTPKYWIVERGGAPLARAEPCPARGGDGFNFGLILELAFRFGQRTVRERIRGRKGEILDVFEKEPKKRPWWAGIAGSLSR